MRALKIGCSPMRGRTQPMAFDCKHGYAQEEYRPIADTIKRTEIGLLTGAAEGREQGFCEIGFTRKFLAAPLS